MTPEEQEQLWKECCEKVAKKHNEKSFDSLIGWNCGCGNVDYRSIDGYMKQIAQLFAAEMVKKAIRLAQITPGQMTGFAYSESDILEQLNLTSELHHGPADTKLKEQ